VNGGARQPVADLADLSIIYPDFAEDFEDQIDIDLSFVRKIKVIRISQKYIVLCDFLDFYAGYKKINKFEFYNNLFNYSPGKISSDLDYKFKKPAASIYGITRSFF